MQNYRCPKCDAVTPITTETERCPVCGSPIDGRPHNSWPRPETPQDAPQDASASLPPFFPSIDDTDDTSPLPDVIDTSPAPDTTLPDFGGGGGFDGGGAGRDF